MTPLGEKLAKRIRIGGPITIADYMAACLGDPDHGYYLTREPFGRTGDFVTAPEISQMFGELIGVWCVIAWEALGAPSEFTLAELGPGRGTLMADLLRAAQSRPSFVDALDLRLVETSPRLRAKQESTLAPFGLEPTWHDSVGSLPDAPLILIANEFFDAVPIHQYQRTETGWAERMVTLSGDDHLAFGLRPMNRPPTAFSGGATEVGDIVETSPASRAIMASLAQRVTEFGGVLLIIDYGYSGPASAETLQAVRQHSYTEPLAEPGEADITAHVDFSALAETARAQSAGASPLIGQGDFLLRLGILERAARLGQDKDEATRRALQAAVDRLCRPEDMGTLFKVLAISRAGLALPGFESEGSGNQGRATC